MKTGIINIHNREYKESNFIIYSKSSRGLLDNKILAICFFYLDKFQDKLISDMDAPIVDIKIADIRRQLGMMQSGSIYGSLRQSAKRLTDQKIYIEDVNNKKNFSYINLVMSAESKNGVFTVRFNPYIKDYLLQLKKNYTKFSIDLLCSFTNKYAYNLYQLLKARSYGSKEKEELEIYEIKVPLSELKFDLGIVDATEEGVQKILDKSTTPDYDEAVEAASRDRYASYHDLYRYALEKAINEINEKTDIYVKISDLIRHGQGGKISDIVFKVDFERKKPKEEILENEDKQYSKENILEMISDLIDEPLKLRDIRAIAEAADYDYSKVEKAYEVAKTQTKINNLTAFLISAITDNYENNIVEKKKKSRFCNIKQHNYDFEELEKLWKNH